MVETMKALTLWEPWTSLAALLFKGYETRSWYTRYRGPLALHAAQWVKLPHEVYERIWSAIGGGRAYRGSWLYDLEHGVGDFGCVIATAELVGCHQIYGNPANHVRYFVRESGLIVPIDGPEQLLGDFTPGRYAWELANVQMLPEPIPAKGRRLPEPIPAKGRQGLWDWTREVDGGGSIDG